ncbi:MAG TPA: CpaF family protein [Acidimicrobiia bacterium]|nr:CpaF family protein [Acidimicrobiia bacterium]
MTAARAATGSDAALKSSVHAQLLATVRSGDAAADSAVREQVSTLLLDRAPLLERTRRDRLVDELVADALGFGPLEPYLDDPDVTEILVNGPTHAFVERNGRMQRVSLCLDADGIRRVVERIIAPLGLRLDRTAPIVDARLPDGSRIHAVIPPLALDGPYVSIRRFSRVPISLDAFGSQPVTDLLEAAVSAGWNIVVAGGTSAGKTTLLNALAGAIPRSDRVVTIEETAELQLGCPHLVRLEARPPNAEGVGAVTVRDLVRAALRMRPDRIVVGEVRGGEAFDMLQALNTGHDGSLTTVHANGVAEAVQRLETLVLLAGAGLPIEAVRAQIAASIDAVVFVARGAGGQRFITDVAELHPSAGHGSPPTVRTLFSTGPGGLTTCAEPRRAARRCGSESS